MMYGGKRRRTKTFTGCWTCRSRRVKCDERTPSCQRCSQFGVTCQGYGVRLSWLTAVNQDPAQLDSDEQDVSQKQPARREPSRRSYGNTNASPAPRLSSPEIDVMLERIDDCPTGSSRTEKGVFSVFTIQKTTVAAPEEPASAESSPGDFGQRASYAATCAAQTPLSNSIPTPSTQNHEPITEHRHREILQTPAALSHRDHVPEESYEPDDLDLGTAGNSQVGRISSYPASDVTISPGDGDFRRGDALLPPQPSSHLDLLSMPASQKRLIHHWVTFTSRKLVLLDEPHNPCRTMMLPMALKGLTSSSAASTADIAVFHAVCACAAYNLYELGGRASELDRVLALRHDQEAIHHLRHNLAQADSHRDQSFAMAIMACITIEAISGNTRRWRAHVAGGLAYLEKLRSRRRGAAGSTAVEEVSSAAFQSHMVSMAILCGCDVPPELKAFLDGADGLELAFPYYGVSAAFLRSQDRLNTLAAAAAAAATPAGTGTTAAPPPPDPRELDAFELQMYLNFPTYRFFPSSSSPSSSSSHAPPPPPSSDQQVAAAVVHHVAQAFYYAGLVFLQRAVRRAPAESVQELVGHGLAQLEAIESATGGSAGSVMLWPAWILAAECATPALQARAAAWLRAKRALGFRNLAVLHDVAAAVWEARARGDAATSWQDLVAEERYDVFRL